MTSWIWRLSSPCPRGFQDLGLYVTDGVAQKDIALAVQDAGHDPVDLHSIDLELLVHNQRQGFIEDPAGAEKFKHSSWTRSFRFRHLAHRFGPHVIQFVHTNSITLDK